MSALKRIYSYFQGYQFWTRADDRGYFIINHVHIGQYNLYAWVPGFIGDYRCDALINISQGIVPCICVLPQAFQFMCTQLWYSHV